MKGPILVRLAGFAFVCAATTPCFAQCQIGKLEAAVPQIDADFGIDVAVDGTIGVVGAYLEDTSFGSGSGAAHVFELSPSGWTEIQLLSGASPQDQLGIAVGLDGTTLAVGARSDDAGGHNVGAVYIYELQPGRGFQFAQKLTPSQPDQSGAFGEELAIQGDTLVVGAPAANAAYVFERVGGVWNEVHRHSTGAQDGTGVSVALDGTRVAIGAYRADDAALEAGRVTVLERGSSVWVQTAVLTASDAALGDWFGYSIALEGDTLITSSLQADVGAVETGELYVFDFAGGSWSESTRLIHPAAEEKDHLGNDLDLEGDRLLVGAWHDDAEAMNSGAVHVFRREQGTWSWSKRLTTHDGAAFDWLGWSVDSSGDVIFAGAYGDDGAGCSGTGASTACTTGSVAVFDASGAPGLLLTGELAQVSLSSGGAQTLSLSACHVDPSSLYIVLGSATGTAPGLWIDGFILPLVYDLYTHVALASPNYPPWQNFLGLLDGVGQASASFVLPPGTSPTFAGVTLYHAALVLPSAPGQPIQAVSGAVSLDLLP